METQGIMQAPTQRYGTETCGHCDQTFPPFPMCSCTLVKHCQHASPTPSCRRVAIIASSSISDPQPAEMQPVGLYCLFIFMHFYATLSYFILGMVKIEPRDSCMSSTCFTNKLCPGMHFFTKPKMVDTDGASLLDSEILVLFCSSLYFFSASKHCYSLIAIICF